VRPVELTVAGMRSYRTQQTLNFSDRSLMAILGDTGSGKSSLLEALYGALYGGSTWDARGLGALIADGIQTLQIELVFQARGKTFTVSRSTSRKNYPPSKHVFDGPGGEHLDGEKDVNRRIVELVGLTGQEFLRVVILPQGRFGQLLQGTAGERTPILRGILGLGVLDRVRDIADRQATDLGLALEPIVAARARLYPNPQAIVDMAAADSKQQGLTVERLGTAARALRDLETATQSITTALPAIGAAVEPARTIDLAPVQVALAAADEAAITLTAREQDLTSQVAALEKQDADLKADLIAAAAAGTTPAALATMTAALTHVATTLPRLTEEAAGHAQAEADITAAADQLTTDGEAAQASVALVEAHRLTLSALETAAQEASDKARQQRDRIAAVGAALAAVTPQRERLSAGAASILTRAWALHAARGQLALAAAAQATAAEALAELQAVNAAAHVARQHKAGQPCPVCQQTLPATFTAPVIVGEQDLVKELATAERRAVKATAEERQAERAKDTEQQALLGLAATAFAATHTVIQLLSPTPDAAAFDTDECSAAIDAAVQRILGLPADCSPNARQIEAATAALTGALVTIARVDAAEQLAASPAATPTMEDVEQERAATAAELRAAQDQLQSLTANALRLEAEHRAGSDALDRRRRDHKVARDRTAQTAQDLARDIRALPELLSGPLVPALGLTAADPGAALLAAGKLPEGLLTHLRGEISDKQTVLEQLNAQRETLSTQLRRLDAQRTQLRDTHVETVDLPRASARRTWERAHNTLARVSASLTPLHDSWAGVVRTAQAPPLPPAPRELSAVADVEVADVQLRAEVTALQTRLGAAVAHIDALLGTAHDAVTLAHRRAKELLTTAGATSLDDLAEQLSKSKHELRLSTVLAERAAAQIPLAEGLDVGVRALSDQLKILRQVKDLLNPSSFPQYVVEQRQVALLRIASSLFGQLTRDGYGFGEDFMIVDRRTGHPRHPKTLSGGETFLASLALALALVEISNRSGGQLDCLFLDEGFGSLDSSILGEALDVLRLQATGGRLVGVISHLHAVAAELDDVLVVTKEVEGSSFRWLDPNERDAYLLDEAAVGLLS
jgi:exonuclease SbcC